MTDPIDAFLNAGIEERLRMIGDDASAASLKAVLGEAGYADYRRMVKKFGPPDRGSLAFGAPKNLIFIPGVMGSLLHSKTHGGVWWIDLRTRARIDQLRLSADGTQDDPASNDIVPTTSDPSYDGFMRAALHEEDFGHEIYAYDWRKPIRHAAVGLCELIKKLHEENGGKEIHLVAHSMGGLVVRTALMNHAEEISKRIGKIVFVGTPHYGSPSIAGYLKNHLWGFELMTVLGLYLSRETLRSLWGVLALLPAPAGVYPGTRQNDPAPWHDGAETDPYVHPCANFDLYQVDQYKLDLSSEQDGRLQTVLDDAASFHRALYGAHQTLGHEERERMLMIAGVGYQTLFRLAYEPGFLGLWERTGKITERVRDNPHREGDGRVPLASAALDDVAIRYAKGVHDELPNIPLVYRGVFRFLKGQSPDLPETVAEALSTHLSGTPVSDIPNLDGGARKGVDGDPGLWNLEPPNPEIIARLKAEVEQERLPSFTRIRLL